jgi:LysM repeat protein
VASQPTDEAGTGGTEQPTEAAPTTEAPAAPAPPPASGSESYVWHTVQRGETLYSIARRYGTSVSAITRMNGLSNPNQIYAGQKLKIPTSGGGTSGGSGSGCRIRHTVKQGEWVYQIARNYGVTPQSILAANSLSNPNLIYAGMVLCIP